MKQNVLFILVDCLRADKCYGNNRTVKTPNIDSLIKNGIFFSKTIATTTTTSPSVASIFTGLYPFGHGVYALKGNKLDGDKKTLAVIFKENGYNTYAEVTGPLLSCTGLDIGFDSFSYREAKEYFVDKWGDTLIEKFKNGKFKKPWFTFLHLWELHYPRFVPKSFNKNKFGRNRYERALSGLDAKLGDLFNHIDFNNTTVVMHGDHGEMLLETVNDEYLYELETQIRSIPDIPRKVLAGIMRKVFKLLNLNLKKLPDFAKRNCKPKTKKNQKKRFFDKLFGHGFHIYDCGIIVPLVISGKSIRKNMFVSKQVRQVDIFSTLIDLFGFKYDKYLAVHGQSLIPLIKGEDFTELAAYCEAVEVHRIEPKYWKVGLRTPKYKFIHRPYNSDKEEELYDLEKDPLEKRNIIKSQPEVGNSLKQQLLHIRESDFYETKLTGHEMSNEEKSLLTERLKNLGYI